MRILHSADLHLDAPFAGRPAREAEFLRRELLAVPEKLADICLSRQCDLVLLAGDLFDGAYSRESYRVLYASLERMAVPVFISPGNHDHCGVDSPWEREIWPENVRIFTKERLEAVVLPELNCRIYGAGYQGMDCSGLLDGFIPEGPEQYQIGLLHADPTQAATPYCPMTAEQVRRSGLQYLALGHIHKGGSLRTGNSLCAWPGCPMGRGFDELGAKGVILVTLDETVQAAFMPIDTPRFYDEEVVVGESAHGALANVLPALESQDFYRVTFTGYCPPIDLDSLYSAFSHIPHLTLRDNTLPEQDLWGTADEDSLEGVFFSMLQQASQGENPAKQERAKLAARIARQILDGQEVKLP